MRSILKKVLDTLLVDVLAPAMYLYNRSVRYRLQAAAGRAAAMTIKEKGKDLRIHGYCAIVASDNLKIGDYVRIGANAHINCLGGVTIGNNVQISRNVTIYSANHNYAGAAIPYDDTYLKRTVVVEDSVWIGMGAKLLPGVRIGEGAIIGMGAVVTKDVPPLAVVVGSEQRIVKYRDEAQYNKLKAQQMYFGKIHKDL